ncbi:MAG TPA: tetratricopeptide repeat protein, partial [Kofleriaceae bacterium]|nr:tetratricopeptide repeat protein [Kofleriaceae bacterium]
MERDPAARHPSMRAIARALDRALARRRAAALAGIGVLAIGVTAAIASRAASPATCTSAREQAARAWSPARRARLDAAYRAMPATGSVVTRGLDAYVAAWTTMHTESCEATHVRGEQSAPLLDSRMQCLHERLVAVEALADGLAHGDAAVLARGGEALASLRPVDDCAAARVSGRAPITPRGAAARLELARIHALRPLGRASDVVARARPLVELGQALGDRALVAEARLAIADALAGDIQLDAAAEAFTAAELAAESAGDDHLRARALLAHASLAGAVAFDRDAAAQLLARARAVLTRLDDDEELVRRADVAEAALTGAGGDQAAGARMLQAVIAKAPREGREAWHTAVALRDLANALGEQGRFADALPYAREAVAVAEAALGPDHVDVSETLSVLALTLHFADAAHDARATELASRALAIKERARGADHVSLSSTLMVQALIARDGSTTTGHAEARAATDRAIALRRRAYGSDNPLVLALLSERGSLAADAGEHAHARAAFAEALPGLVRAWGESSPAVVQARESLALIAEREGDYARCAAELIASPGVARLRCLVR